MKNSKMAAHTCNPSPRETEAGDLLQVLSLSGPHSKTVSNKQNDTFSPPLAHSTVIDLFFREQGNGCGNNLTLVNITVKAHEQVEKDFMWH